MAFSRGDKESEHTSSASGLTVDTNGDTTAAATFSVLTEISNLLNTGLDNEELLMCTKLIESGVNPTSLALLVLNVKQQSEQIINSRK